MYLIRDGHRAGSLKPHLTLLHALTFCPTGIQLDFERVFFPPTINLNLVGFGNTRTTSTRIGHRKKPNTIPELSPNGSGKIHACLVGFLLPMGFLLSLYPIHKSSIFVGFGRGDL